MVMPMNILRKTVLIPTLTLVVGLMGGFFLGIYGEAKSEDSKYEKLLHDRILRHPVFNATESVILLKSAREGKLEPMVNRLELMLDLALADIDQEYTPALDVNEHAAKSLALAREYRATYPSHYSDESAEKAKAALAIKTPPTINQEAPPNHN
jgi:hypothetical protein